MKKPRKTYPSDDKKTLRVTPFLHKLVIAAAKADGRTVEKFVERTLVSAMSKPK